MSLNEGFEYVLLLSIHGSFKKNLQVNKIRFTLYFSIQSNFTTTNWFGRHYDFLALALFKQIQIFVISKEQRRVTWYFHDGRFENKNLTEIA